MAFKSMKEYNDNRYSGLFRLVNDGDSARVVFLYRSQEDVLVASAHYIKSTDYTGYVHCCGRGCSACEKGIRVQDKLFIPLWNEDQQEIQFWDRNTRFESQLVADVFSRSPNPSEYIFKITRHGAAGDINTKYSIKAVAQNKIGYEGILKNCGETFPDAYSKICREYSSVELSDVLSSSDNNKGFNPADLPEYQITPRGVEKTSSSIESFDIPDTADDVDEDDVEF